MLTIAAQIVLHSVVKAMEEAARKKAAEVSTEKWERARRDLKGKIEAKKKFIEEQNNIQRTALAKGERMKSADALRQNLRAAGLARETVERESKELNAMQEDGRPGQAHGQKAKKLLSGQISCCLMRYLIGWYISSSSYGKDLKLW